MRATILALSLLAVACGPAPDQGNVALELRFERPESRKLLRGVLTGIVDTIRVTISDASGPIAQRDFDYEATNPQGVHEGTVTDIPAGINRTFLVEAMADTDVVYRGITNGVEIKANQTTPVAITLQPAYPVDLYPPAAIDDLTAQTVGDAIVLRWTATGDDGRVGLAHYYEVRRSLSSINSQQAFEQANEVSDPPVPLEAGTKQSMEIRGLVALETYYFAIKVFDSDNNASGLSNDASVTFIPDQTAPDRIDDLRVHAMTTTSVTLQWTAPGDDGKTGKVASYNVRYSTAVISDEASFNAATSFAWPAVAIVDGGAVQTLEITGLQSRNTVHFAIKAADEVPNWSSLSNVVSETPRELEPPQAVLDLIEVGSTSSSVTLAWTAPADLPNLDQVLRYEIRYSQTSLTAANFATATEWNNPPSPAAPGSTNQVTITGLQGRRHTFALMSYDLTGNRSSLSNICAATPGAADTTPPSRVADLAVSQISGSSLTLTWTAPGDDGDLGTVTAYDLRFSIQSIDDDALFDAATLLPWGSVPIVSGGLAQSFTIYGLSPGQTLHFALKATDDTDNTSLLSNTVSATTSP